MIIPSSSHRVRLTRHPKSEAPAIEKIEAQVDWTESSSLVCTYALTGDLIGLRIPLSQSPCRAERLWEHTCFEAFVAVKGSPEYYEFNFAPSGEWAIYRFKRYRDQTPLEDDMLAPKITVRQRAGGLDLEAVVRLDRLPVIPPRAKFCLALAAVIEDESGILSYWALRHPPGKPDFHHPEAFSLELAPPEVDATNESAMERR
ncbi:MAG TPA: DOMON-like domain-containing protein [Candidatus Binatia bacterium]|nr:DOMON-like domain-containing protein [Candidatus Binatia bacterium]